MMTIEALAAAAQEPVERVKYWAQLVLVPSDGVAYPHEAVHRARLISFAVRRGMSAEAIALACVQDDIIGRYADPDSRALTLDWHGTAMRFCSEACRDRFVEHPSRYGA